MAVPKYHLTDAGGTSAFDPGSGTYDPNAFGPAGPGSLLMDADAWLISPGSTLVLQGGAWTATINGKITSSNFGGGGNAGIYLQVTDLSRSSITVGATGVVTGYHQGILSESFGPTDIINKGRIAASDPSGQAIYYHADVVGNFTINNSGWIVSSFRGIELAAAGGEPNGTHTIVNSGTIDAPTALLFVDSTTTEKVTNSGLIHGDVFLGQGHDAFTDFAKAKIKGKIVTKHGLVDGTIDLGEGNDTFKGGNSAEKVKDGDGADTYKLGGGNDIFFAAPNTGLDGVDTIDGGAGRDTYDGSNRPGTIGGTNFRINLDKIAHGGIAANSIVFDVAGPQADHIFNFEDVIGGPGSDIIYGNASANHLVGGVSSVSTVVHDELFGLGGNDALETTVNNSLLDGGDGNDVLKASGENSRLFGGKGNDTLEATGSHNQLFGGDGNDVLIDGGDGGRLDGGNGNDILKGGTGDRDDLYGGSGRDIMTGGNQISGSGGEAGVFAINVFHFTSLSDSGVTAATRDVITDFFTSHDPGVASGGDRIDLSAIDADTVHSGAQPFHFIGLDKWHHAPGDLRYVWTADQTIVEADVDGNGKADFSIALDGHITLLATDFILT